MCCVEGFSILNPFIREGFDIHALREIPPRGKQDPNSRDREAHFKGNPPAQAIEPLKLGRGGGQAAVALL